jgi:hypothetical protein
MARTIPDWVRRAKKGATEDDTRGFKHGFRSGLEVTLGKQIEATGKPVLFETFKLPYIVPEKRHFYTPDFLLPNMILIEGKGIFDSTDRAKHLFIKTQYPELDIRFVFSRSKAPIGPGSKTTLADWCLKYGYKFADKLIPAEWFDEPPKRHPMDIIAEGPYRGALPKPK